MDTISVVDVAAAVEEELERLKVARPALFSRISRAENILVTHLSCKRAGIIKPRVRGGELAGYLVKGTGGAVYRVEPKTFSCSCPDHHRSGLKGCKHGIACYVLGRAFRPAPVRQAGRRCVAEPKITRHDIANDLLSELEGASGFEHVGEIAPRALEGRSPGEQLFTGQEPGDSAIVEREHAASPSYGPMTCSRCLDGQTYDEREGWIACERCSGTGLVLAFLYEHAQRRLAGCVGCGRRYPHRELIEVTEDHESLTWFVGDKLCRQGCAAAHGAL